MATTTNYGWTTPDDTALVKDGASAIRSLGTAVDTTTKNLNPSTTLGDIEYRSSTANTNTRLAIGTTGQILAVSGGVPAWTTPAGGSGLTLIDEVSFSASMGVNVDSVFSTTYNNYKIIGNIKGDSFALDATMKMRVSATNTSTNYILQSLNSASSTTTSSNNAAATDMLFGEVHTTYSIETYDIVAPFLTQRTSMMGMYGHSSGAMRMTYQAQTDATSFTGFALIFSAAATGTVSVYGYAKE